MLLILTFTVVFVLVTYPIIRFFLWIGERVRKKLGIPEREDKRITELLEKQIREGLTDDEFWELYGHGGDLW